MTMTTSIVGVVYLANSCGLTRQAITHAFHAGNVVPTFAFTVGRFVTPFWSVPDADRIAREYLERGGWR